MQKNKTPDFMKRILIISQLQFQKHPIFIRPVFLLSLGVVFSLFSFSSCSQSHLSDEIAEAEELLWSAPDSCLAFLEGLDYSTLSEYDSCVCALQREHALFKVQYGLEDDSNVMALKDYFEAQGDHRYAGEACYIVGRNFVLQQNLPMATFYQKAAEEHLLNAKRVPAQLLGLVYLGLGNCAEYERLFEIANAYYERALPYFHQSADSLYIGCTFRNLCNTIPMNDSSEVLKLIDSALLYLSSPRYETHWIDAAITKHSYIEKDSTSSVHYFHLLCDTLGQVSYAANLCEFYLADGNITMAAYYLALSELDTINSTWSKEHYLFNKARYYHEIGRKDSAYFILRDLHLWQTEEIEASAHTRAYMVEQRYDAERERADRIEAEADKHRAHLIIFIVCISALLLTAFLLMLLQREHMKKIREEALAKAEMERMKVEHEYQKQQLLQKHENLRKQLLLRQQNLQDQLKLRLSITSELKKQRSRGEKFTESAYNRLISAVVFLSREQLDQLKEDFDAAYAGLLANLSARYKLTSTDTFYIVLITLGCSINEISELANVSAHSVGNRKQMLRQHVGADCNIDDWLRAEVDAHMKRVLEL